MKLNFTPSAGSTHSRCLDCGRETLRTFRRDGRLLYHCDSCGQDNFRALIIDPKVKWWVDDTCEYWHETAGIFLADSQGRFLLFERMQYPFGLAVTAGHVDTGESPLGSAQRELYEETGVALRPQDFLPYCS